MSKAEFILLIPGILYGIALVDLLKIVRHGTKYWETIMWTFILFLVVIADWFKLYNFVDKISENITLFTLYILSPLIFVQVCFTLTPGENDTDMKKYFLDNRKAFFTTVVLYIISKLSIQYLVENDGKLIIRLLGISLYSLCIFSDKIWVRTIPVLVTVCAIYETFILQNI